jgi:4-hydroxy-4-methyl-2-oxoglutarate aldolase
VNAGDFVLADADGVVVVERNKLAGLIPVAHKKVEDEAKRIAQIKQGNTAASWLQSSLVAAGVLKQGESL